MSLNTPMPSGPLSAPPRPAEWTDYLKMARLDHMTKHIFIVPGIVFAAVLRDVPVLPAWPFIAMGFIAAVLIASANYLLNEWLDRPFDAFHPDKSSRPAVQVSMSPVPVFTAYAACSIVAMALAWSVGTVFFVVSLLFWLSGVVYNVEPLRFKDKPYVDVLCESLNNPIRMMLGWSMVDPESVAPMSLLLSYWMGGAFLMGAKRLSEYREIAAGPGVAVLQRYRRSFRHYTEERLTISCFVYALLSTFLLGVFLVKYRIEYVLAVPLIVLLFGHYLALAMRVGSVAQKPEKLFREKRLMAIGAAAVAALVLFSVVDVPALHEFSVAHFVTMEPRP